MVEDMSDQNPFQQPQPDNSPPDNTPSPYGDAPGDAAAGHTQPNPPGPYGAEQGSGQGPGAGFPPGGYQDPGWSWQASPPYAYGQHPTGPGYPGDTSGQPGSGGGVPGAPAAGKRPHRSATIIVAAVVAAVVGAGTGIGAFGLLSDHQDGSTSTVKVNSQHAPQPAGKKKGSIEAAAKKIKPSVVTITEESGSGKGLGSGVVTDDNGHILTNAHVVAGSGQEGGKLPGGFDRSSAPKITVTSSKGTSMSAKVVGVDKTDDLAVIKAKKADQLTPATFAKSDNVDTGQSVLAVGAPLGLSQTVTNGIVSNTQRPVRSGKSNDAVYEAIQTDAAINPGNSGGPLVNLNGDVIGIDSAIKSTGQSSGEGQQAGNIGIGFAIPSHIATRVASQLSEHGNVQHAALGVTVSGTENDQSASSSSSGVPLRSVQSGKAAAKAGLKKGDEITKVDRFKPTTADGLIAAVRYHAPGEHVSISYERDGSSHTAKVTLGSS